MIPQTKKVIKGFLKLFILKMFPTKVCFENYNEKVGFYACSKLIAGMPIHLIFYIFYARHRLLSVIPRNHLKMN